jgi:acetylornithine deacetylase
VTFLGSHLDVVPANPETWEVDPFKLTREGDKLYGRGTTDCLGHVALLTELMCCLAEKKPTLKRTVLVVFIANEENGEIEGIGVDGLNSSGKLAELRVKNGPVVWVDSADTQPCLGTVGNMVWNLKVTGKLFHSGLPHKAINPIEMLMEALAYVQKRFYEDFPAHPKEAEYKYVTSSTMKPTQMECAKGSSNQIPPWASVSGDCRITPFYAVKDVKEKIEGYVKEVNDNVSVLPTRGPWSKYELPDEGKKVIDLHESV